MYYIHIFNFNLSPNTAQYTAHLYFKDTHTLARVIIDNRHLVVIYLMLRKAIVCECV